MQIIRQFRKTISIKIDKKGEVIVKAPRFTTKKTILNFLDKHKDWIETQQNKILKNKKNFEIGEEFYFFGELVSLLSTSFKNPSSTISSHLERGMPERQGDYIVSVIHKKQGELFFENGQFFTSLQNSQDIQNAFIKFYKKEAKKYIVLRTVQIAEKLDLEFNNIRITSASTRWGSCSSKKNLNFSWKLILTKKEAIDYVIIHELAHLREMNHSKNFWDLVEKYAEIIGNGDYKEHKIYLKNFTEANNF